MNIFKSTIPKWVRKLQDKPHREGLIQLSRASPGPFDKPREMNIALYGFTDETALHNAMAEVSEMGWACTWQRQEDFPQQKLLTATMQSYQIKEGKFMSDVDYFKSIANKYGVNYDGWFASA